MSVAAWEVMKEFEKSTLSTGTAEVQILREMFFLVACLIKRSTCVYRLIYIIIAKGGQLAGSDGGSCRSTRVRALSLIESLAAREPAPRAWAQLAAAAAMTQETVLGLRL